MLTKVTIHSKNKLQAKKQTWVQFVFAVPWIIRNKTSPPIVGCLPLSYTFLSYCNGLLKILQRVRICSCPLHVRELKSFQLQGGLCPPDQGLWDSAPGPRWGLCPQTPVIGSRSTRSPCAPRKQPMAPLVPVLWRRRCESDNKEVYFSQ